MRSKELPVIRLNEILQTIKTPTAWWLSKIEQQEGKVVGEEMKEHIKE